ncbi:lipase family protein [Burkholderia gladioli]|uniref:lipase family protein n=1 Tax=Burkholderia gladioli TaxID=28095 RepID=UPI003F78EB8A
MTPHDFALLARDAYTAAPDIGVADSASRAIVRQTAAGLVVAFPGTDNAASWIADLDMLPVDVAGIGRLHRGFWDAWSVIAPAVVAEIGGQPVTLVGHSLGAALAICAAAALTSAARPPVAVYGFEPPRVAAGPHLGLLLAGVPVNLFKNGNDVVPDVPPGWQHAALLTHIGTAALPFPNIEDHELARVTAALAPATLESAK